MCPTGVVHLAGGPSRFLELLHDQLRRRADLPRVVVQDGWSFVVDGFDPDAGRSNEALLTIADGVIGTNGAPLFAHPGASPEVLAAGVYDGEGPPRISFAGPRWAALGRDLAPEDRVRRVLDLRTGLLGEDVDGETAVQSVRFSSLARPGIVVLRADVDPPEDSDALVSPHGAVRLRAGDGYEWMATRGTGGSITAAAWQERDLERNRLDRIAAYVTEPRRHRSRIAPSPTWPARAFGLRRAARRASARVGRRWERADIRDRRRRRTPTARCASRSSI